MKKDRILILGIGNFLMGDEGVGIHAVRHLKKCGLPENVDLLDGGTGGFHLLSYLQDYPVVILIDATIDKKELGTITLLKPKFSGDFPPALSAHDIGLKDLIDAATLSGKLPEIFLLTVSIDETELNRISIELSPALNKIIPEIDHVVFDILEKIETNRHQMA